MAKDRMVDQTIEEINPLDEMLSDTGRFSESLLTGPGEEDTPQARDVRQITEDDRQKSKRDESFVYPQIFSGLNLSWSTASSLEISTGQFGVEGAIYDVKSVIPVTIQSSIADAWYYIAIAVNNDDPNKFVGVASTTFNDIRAPSGFTTKKIVGSIRTDSSGDIAKFVQCGKFWRKDYTLLEAATMGSGLTSTAAKFESVLPETSCRGFFTIRAIDALVQRFRLHAFPDDDVATLAAIGVNTQVAASDPVMELQSGFEMNTNNTDIWAAIQPTPSNTAQLKLRSYTDDLS